MRITIRKKLADSLLALSSEAELGSYGFDTDKLTRYHYDSITVNIERLKTDKLKSLQELVSRSRATGAKALARDIRQWIEMRGTDDYDKTRMRQVHYLEDFLVRHFKGQKEHRVYEYNSDAGSYLAYYVYDIRYHETERRSDYTIPEHVTIRLGWEELGDEHSKSISFDAEDIVWKNLTQCLNDNGLFFETPALRQQYEEDVARYDKVFKDIGGQYLATGFGESESGRWYTSRIALDKEGQPTNVVVDIPSEDDEERSSNRRANSLDKVWWKRRLQWDKDESEDEVEDVEIEEEKLEQIPVHTTVYVFALKKHMRMKVRVNQLAKYKYDKSMGDKLILPKESTDLVKTLVSYEGGFQDIIKSKGGGAIILCAGVPGTGKTLTAEVYSEVMEMPLYTVQCSQLGTDPDDLEKQLLKVFSRAERWRAILLLDEADVYVSERGSNLQQNAIVGVFLRVLEYYRGVLFLTTNRDDLVDDAIASRCIAKIVYDVPTSASLKKIWAVLSEVQDVPVSSAVINSLVKKYPRLTGRDVKNLLKLAKLVHKGEKSISVETIEFVKRFKPTR